MICEINESLSSGVFQKILKAAKRVQMFKFGKKGNCEIYRLDFIVSEQSLQADSFRETV